MFKYDWFIDFNPILEELRIKELNGAYTPVAQVATPLGEWTKNPDWKKRAYTIAFLLKGSLKMYKALLAVKRAMDLENAEPDMDTLYDTVKDALKEATYEPDTSTP